MTEKHQWVDPLCRLHRPPAGPVGRFVHWMFADMGCKPCAAERDQWVNYDLHAGLAFALMHSTDLDAEDDRWHRLTATFKLSRHESGDRLAYVDAIRVSPNPNGRH